MTNTKHTPTPWSINDWTQKDAEIRIGANGTSLILTVNIRDVSINEQKANAEFIVRACNSHEELLEACNKAIEATLDKVVGQAIKDGSLLESEMHAGLCLLGYIRRKYLKTYEQAIAKAEGK